MGSWRGFYRNDSGATSIEYAMIAAGIAAAIIAVVTTLGTSLNTMYQSVSDALS